MSRLLALSALVLLSACGRGAALPPQQAPASFAVSMHWHEGPEQLRQAGIAFGVPAEAEGFAVMTTSPGGVAGYRCDVHLVRLEDLSITTQELLGHEFAHCLYGAWHK